MNILFVAINARFVHTNLAVRCLASTVKDHDVQIREFTINHYPHEILEQLYKFNSEVVAFSCYIWNIELIMKVVSSLKKVNPETVIVLGGPEVSYDSETVMKTNDAIDFIISGEAEKSFPALIKAWENNEDYTGIPQLTYRARGNVYTSSERSKLKHENHIPRAYENEYVFDPHQIYYYETSRGCPYRCQFCLSGNEAGLFFMPMERVYQDLGLFLNNQVKQVKFVDRTFNVDPERTMSIWRFLKDHDNGITNFHFEISTASLTDEMMAFLKTVPEGLFQFEIGVQTTNKEALKAISRYADQEEDFKKIILLNDMNTIHLHVDLIAGLPHEDFFSFRKSFNDVFSLKTDMVQLGFLKLLKGSGLRERELEYEYVYQDAPPYEVLSTHQITYGELLLLKGVENVLEKYWNSGKFKNTILMAINFSGLEPFSFFESLAEYWEKENPLNNKTSQGDQVAYMHNHLKNIMPDSIELMDAVMAFDLAANGSGKEIHKFLHLNESSFLKDRTHELLHNALFVQEHFKDMSHLPAKKMLPYLFLLSMPPGFFLLENSQLLYDAAHTTPNCFAFIYPRNSDRTKNRSNIVSIKGETRDESTVCKTGNE